MQMQHVCPERIKTRELTSGNEGIFPGRVKLFRFEVSGWELFLFTRTRRIDDFDPVLSEIVASTCTRQISTVLSLPPLT